MIKVEIMIEIQMKTEIILSEINIETKIEILLEILTDKEPDRELMSGIGKGINSMIENDTKIKTKGIPIIRILIIAETQKRVTEIEINMIVEMNLIEKFTRVPNRITIEARRGFIRKIHPIPTMKGQKLAVKRKYIRRKASQ